MILGLGRSPGEGNGCPLQYSGLQKSIDYIVHGVTKNQTPLSDFQFHFPQKKRIIFLVQDIFFLEEGGSKGMAKVLSCILLLLPLRGWMGSIGIDYLIGADQKITDWLINTAFPVKAETAVRLGT